MKQLKFGTVGDAWVHLIATTLETGSRMGEEGLESLGVRLTFAPGTPDRIVERFGDPAMLAEMEKVFFSQEPNRLGHNYAGLMRGPKNRHDLSDVIELLKVEPWSKRALVTLCGSGNGRVPCINAIQFLVRDGELHTIYFARGQDVYRKFYADAVCIGKMAGRVAASLGLRPGFITAFLGSGHLYDADMPAARKLLDEMAGRNAA